MGEWARGARRRCACYGRAGDFLLFGARIYVTHYRPGRCFGPFFGHKLRAGSGVQVLPDETSIFRGGGIGGSNMFMCLPQGSALASLMLGMQKETELKNVALKRRLARQR